LTVLGCRYWTNLDYGRCKKVTELQQRAIEWIAHQSGAVAPRIVREIGFQGTTRRSRQVLSTDPNPSYGKRTKNPFTTEIQNCQTGVSPKIPDLGKPMEQSGFLWTKNAQIGSTTRFSM